MATETVVAGHGDGLMLVINDTRHIRYRCANSKLLARLSIINSLACSLACLLACLLACKTRALSDIHFTVIVDDNTLFLLLTLE